jgi:hypothetical protein
MRVGLWNACQGRWNDRRTRHRHGVATDSGASTNFVTGSRDNLSGRGGPAKRLHSLHTRQDARPVRRWLGTGQSVPAGAAYRRHADGWRPLSASAARSSSERARGRGREAHQGIAAHAFCGGGALVLATPSESVCCIDRVARSPLARRRSHPLISGSPSTTAASRFLEQAPHHAPTGVNAVLACLLCPPSRAGRVAALRA